MLELRAQPVAPRGPETGFDERGWLARQGVHVVLRGERLRASSAGGAGSVASPTGCTRTSSRRSPAGRRENGARC